MKRILALLAFCCFLAMAPFAAEHIVRRPAKAVGHATTKATEDVAHANEARVKFLV